MLNLSLQWWQLLLIVTGYVTYKELVKYLLKLTIKRLRRRGVDTSDQASYNATP